MTTQRPPSELGTIILVLTGPIAPTDISALCDRARVLLEGSEADLVLCDVGSLVDPDAVTVDALARLQLTAQRLGRRLYLSHACGELLDLLALMGLSDVVPCTAASGVESRGEAEEGEQALGIEEESDPRDPSAGDLEDLD